MSATAEQAGSADEVELFAEAVSRVKELADRIIADGRSGELDPAQVSESLYIAARLFSARTDRAGKTEWHIGEDALNATETVVLVTALLEAADVNLFDMAIWYRRA